MTSFGGYAQKSLDIDLSTGRISIQEVSPDSGLVSRFIGGRGISSKILFDSVGPGTDPLSAENVLVFSTGPLTGSLAPSSSRAVFAAKSPLTGIFGDSNIGGNFAPEVKFAGYDNFVIRGKSSKPVYLWIDDSTVSIKDATSLWGKDSWETQTALREMHRDDSVKVACIGQAGENLVGIAAIMSAGHAAGRAGMGAVMGSKNLKAIVVRGSGGVPHSNLDETMAKAVEFVGLLNEDSYPMQLAKTFGTPLWQDQSYGQGCWSVHNFQRSRMDGLLDTLSCRVIKEKYVRHMTSCFNCPIGCDLYCQIDEGEYAGTKTAGPEYYAFGRFGAMCGNRNAAAVIKANELCDRYGMDVGNTSIPFAFECFEKGLITEKDTGGLSLRWGNHEAIVALVEQIAFRKGFGAVLADGVLRAVEQIGEEARPFAMHVKGMNMNTEDPRSDAQRYYANRYLLSPRGADHLRMQNAEGWLLGFGKGSGTKEEVGRKMVWYENYNALQDMMGVCRFSYVTYTTWPEDIKKKFVLLCDLFNSVTGIDLSQEELLVAADRVNTLERLFNAREGLTKKDDVFPTRFYTEPLPDGPSAGHLADTSPVEWYYRVREYDATEGNPTEELIERLKLRD